MKRILIASPIRGGHSTAYVRTVIALLNSSLCRGPNATYKIDFAWTSGTSVAMARCEIADLFLRRGDDELIFWDADLGSPNPNVMLAMFNRLLSHDLDFVGGAYVGHNFKSQFHGAASSTEAKMNENGLLEMAQIPIGFAKIKRWVFEKIRKDHPHFEYVFRETQMEKAKAGMFEFFPNGLIGPTTGQGKVDRIKAAIEERQNRTGTNIKREEIDNAWFAREVDSIITDSDHSRNIMLGEDFYFCLLARQSGFKMYIDNQLIMPHETSVRLPVQTSTILEAITEQWRWGESADDKEVFQTVEALKKMMGPDHQV